MPVITAQAPLPTTSAVNGTLAKDPPPPPSPPTLDAPVKTEDERLSPRLAAMARREKEIRRMQQQLQSEKDAMKAKEEEYKTSYIPRDRIQKETLAVLLENGLTQDQIMNMVLNGPQQMDPALAEIQKQVKAIQEAQLNTEKMVKEKHDKDYENAVNQIRKEATDLVASNPDYETIKETGSAEAIVELIKETFKEDNVLLSVHEAAKMVEDHLLEDGLKMAALKKVREKLTAQEAPAQPQKNSLADAQAKAPQQPIKTLTNAATATSSKPLSSRDRRDRAIAAFKGQLT